MSRSINGIALFILSAGVSSAIGYRELIVRPRLEAEKAHQQQVEEQRRIDLQTQRDAADEALQETNARTQALALEAKRAAEPPQPYDDGRYWLTDGTGYRAT